MRRWILPSLALLLGLVGSGLPEGLVGSWSEVQGTRTLQLRSDGGARFDGVEYRYEVRGNALVVQGAQGGGWYSFQLEGDQLTISGQDVGVLRFQRGASGNPGTGVVFRADAYGFRMVLPPGWQWRETQAAVIFGHATTPGIVMLTVTEGLGTEDVSRASVKGYQEPPGTDLQPKTPGSLKVVPTGQGQGAYFPVKGKLDGKEAEGLLGAFLTPSGQAVLAFGLTEPARWPELEAAACSMFDSVRLETPSNPAVQEWDQALRGQKLLYMWSYSSSGGGDFGSTSSSKEWHLCANGRYWYQGSNRTHIDVGGSAVTGSSSGRGGEQGSWRIVPSGAGAALRLEPEGGTAYQYPLSKQKKSGSSFMQKHLGDMGVYSDGAAQCP